MSITPTRRQDEHELTGAESTLWPPVQPVSPVDATRKLSGKAAKLAAAAREAAEVRAYQVHPDVIALRIERMRSWVDRLIWTGMILGLAFTAVNVQNFAAGDDAPAVHAVTIAGHELVWWSAWLLDPLVSFILIGALLGEQIISRHQLIKKLGPWVRALKWVALTATYAMNTWTAWESLEPAKILLHSVPPVMVFCAAEAVTDLRHWITEAVRRAYKEAAERARDLAQEAQEPIEVVRVDAAVSGPVHPELTAERADAAALVAEVREEFTGALQALQGDLLQAVRELSAAQQQPPTEGVRTDDSSRTEQPRTETVSRTPETVSPVREETRTEAASRTAQSRTAADSRTEYGRTEQGPASRTGADRTGEEPSGPQEEPSAPMDREEFIGMVRQEILAAADRGDRWEPEYPRLMAQARRSRSWAEKAVREARLSVIGPDASTMATAEQGDGSEPMRPQDDVVAEPQQAGDESDPAARTGEAEEAEDAAPPRTAESGTEQSPADAAPRTEDVELRTDDEQDTTGPRTEDSESRTPEAEEPRTAAVRAIEVRTGQVRTDDQTQDVPAEETARTEDTVSEDVAA
ncbi:hypothetical protein [Sphaerisporangium fuscum]|uniref:hypothetical protein n=1 Tax=Sphaerisporangium fuscum TaxID=2835868 RepID=UPI001BDD55BA|nr:hypothetical protein [Sphaerisporangium fuscum]